FQLLSGLVDADRFHDVGVFFPAIWTQPEFEGTLPRGTPVAQCFPVRRETPEFVFATFDARERQAYDDVGKMLLEERGVYRKRFRAPRSGSRAEGVAKGRGVEPEPPGGG